MPYTINKTNGKVVATVADGTVDNTTDLKIIGKNYAGYGEIQNENFLFLLENFASSSAPPRPIAGQIWFDSGNKKLKFYDNDKESGGKWRTTGGAEIGSIEPSGLTTGDFWWDTLNNQLYAYNGSTYVLVGPQGVAGSGTTQMRSRSVRDTLGYAHAIIEAVVGTGATTQQTVFVISPDAEFTLGPTSAITGFTKIHQGLTLAYTNNPSQEGVTTDSHRFWGTATNSDRLGGYDASEFTRSTNAIFNQQVRFADIGFTVGEKLWVHNTSNTTPTLENTYNDTILFKTTSGGLQTPMQLVGKNILPGQDNNSDIGASGNRFKTVYALSFQGVATEATTMTVAGTARYPSTSTGANTIAVRDGNGDIFANLFRGEATSARYADLAEKYLADAEYEPGTVVVVGGEKEVTASSDGQRAIGAVSTDPAYMMNSELEGGTYIALKGRVPVKVTGPVKKGDQMIPSANGTAIAWGSGSNNVFAIALESNDDVGVKLVECVIL